MTRRSFKGRWARTLKKWSKNVRKWMNKILGEEHWMLTIKSPKKIPASLPNDYHRSSMKNISFFTFLENVLFCNSRSLLEKYHFWGKYQKGKFQQNSSNCLVQYWKYIYCEKDVGSHSQYPQLSILKRKDRSCLIYLLMCFVDSLFDSSKKC